MNDTKQKIFEIVHGSDLDEKQKMLWDRAIQELDAKLLDPILQILESEKQALAFLTENLEDKIQAMTSGKKSDWQEVLEKEKDLLGKIDQ